MRCLNWREAIGHDRSDESNEEPHIPDSTAIRSSSSVCNITRMTQVPSEKVKCGPAGYLQVDLYKLSTREERIQPRSKCAMQFVSYKHV